MVSMVQFIENLEDIAHEYLSNAGVSYSTRGVWRFLMACDQAKTDLIERMNGVTVSKTIKAELPTEDIENVLQDFNYGHRAFEGKGLRDFCHFVSSYYTYAESFYTQLVSTPDILRSGTIDQHFIDRVVERAYNQGEQPRLRNGMKVGRAFRACLIADSLAEVPSIDKKDVEKASQSFSIVLEQVKVQQDETGTEEVFLSVNPLDFFNMSNGTTWSSCHRLWSEGYDHEPGQHAQGSISYGMTPGMMVAYVKEKGTDKLKWRQVIYSDLEQGLAVGSRQYPGRRMAYEGAVIELIQELYGKAMKVEKGLDADQVEDYLANSGAEFGYCDAQHGWGDGQYFALTDLELEDDELYGMVLHANAEAIICLDCGDYIYHQSDNQVLCDDCHNGESCAHCGEYHHECDLIEVGGDYYCQDCAEHLFVYCERCHCYEDRDTSHSVETYYGEQEWCEDCVDSYAFWCEECMTYHSRRDYDEYWVNDGEYSVCEACFTADYFKCANCGEIHSLDDAKYVDEGDDDYYCEDCFEEVKDDLYAEYQADEDEDEDEDEDVALECVTPEVLTPEVGDYIQVHDLGIFNTNLVHLKVGDFAMIKSVRTYSDGDAEIEIEVPYRNEHRLAQTHYATQRLFASQLTNSSAFYKALAGYARDVATLVKRGDFNRRYALKPQVYKLNGVLIPEVATTIETGDYVMIENESHAFTIENPTSVYTQSALFLDRTTNMWTRQYVRISTLINSVDEAV